jgi:hypothetical protein
VSAVAIVAAGTPSGEIGVPSSAAIGATLPPRL